MVDASLRSGRGHLNRCLVLAKALRNYGAACKFFLTDPLSVKPSRLEFPVRLLSEIPERANIVVADGYSFNNDSLALWKARADCFVLIDDLAERPFPADVVINHNLYGGRLSYAAYHACVVLAGPVYALVAEELARARFKIKPHPRILVCFGGGATAEIGRDVAKALVDAKVSGIDVALGFGTPNHDDELMPGAALFHNANMLELMGKATLYVGTLGVTFLEALAAGLEVIGVQVADNQHLARECAQQMGLDVLVEPDLPSIVNAVLRHLHDPSPVRLQFPDGSGAFRAASSILAQLHGAHRFI